MRFALPLAAAVLLAVFAAPVSAATASAQGAAPAASAEQHAHPHRHYISLDQRFEMANTTHDGHLTADQARNSPAMHTVSENFQAIDKDHHGFVTEDDIRTWYKARRAARRQAKEAAAKS